MTIAPPNKPVFPFPPALLALDFAALTAVGICLAELFPRHGMPLGLIPGHWVWPILWVSVGVVVGCGIIQIRILLNRNRPV